MGGAEEERPARFERCADGRKGSERKLRRWRERLIDERPERKFWGLERRLDRRKSLREKVGKFEIYVDGFAEGGGEVS